MGAGPGEERAGGPPRQGDQVVQFRVVQQGVKGVWGLGQGDSAQGGGNGAEVSVGEDLLLCFGAVSLQCAKEVVH